LKRKKRGIPGFQGQDLAQVWAKRENSLAGRESFVETGKGKGGNVDLKESARRPSLSKILVKT